MIMPERPALATCRPLHQPIMYIVLASFLISRPKNSQRSSQFDCPLVVPLSVQNSEIGCQIVER